MFDFGSVVSSGYNYNTNLSTMNMPISSPMQSFVDGNPATVTNWESKIAKFTNNGLHPTSTASPEYTGDNSIVYTYTIYPWEDGTHRQIQEYMLVFIGNNLDREYKLYNMAPIYKLNILMREKFEEYKNPRSRSDKAAELRGLLEIRGERGVKLAQYQTGNNEEIAPNSKQLRDLVDSSEFAYVTRHGILKNWNFCGAVVSKGEATGAFSYIDHLDDSQMTSVVGVVVGQRARVSNIWGKVAPGDRLYLILHRKDTDSPFQWVPYKTRGAYPKDDGEVSLSYKDESGVECRCFIQYIGMCTENKERDCTNYQKDCVLGRYGNAQKAYESYGNLGCIQVQIGV